MKTDQTARCMRCHRPLKDPVSLAMGMGPDCRGRSHSNKGMYYSAGWESPASKEIWVIRQYKRGESGVACAKQLGISCLDFYGLLQKQGVKIRALTAM